MHHVTKSLSRKIITLFVFLLIANVLVWCWALWVFHDYPILLSTAILAYSLGLRHAVDVDHIAAIDNVTRKLMQDGKHPITVGLFFSLGHSTIIIIASVGIAITSALLIQQNYPGLREIGGMLCTTISALFLFLIATMNMVIFISLYQVFKGIRKGAPYIDDEINLLIGNRGMLARRFKLLFRMISQSWQMFPLGFLFALGFDTATEIGLLGIASSQAIGGLSLSSILIFPALFTAGMVLIDTVDNVLMVGAYGWAFRKPIRKIYYNLTITFISVLLAILIGTLELLGLLANKLNLSGWIWDGIRDLNNHSGFLGYLIIIIFVVSWLISILAYHLLRFDEIGISE